MIVMITIIIIIRMLMKIVVVAITITITSMMSNNDHIKENRRITDHHEINNANCMVCRSPSLTTSGISLSGRAVTFCGGDGKPHLTVIHFQHTFIVSFLTLAVISDSMW